MIVELIGEDVCDRLIKRYGYKLFKNFESVTGISSYKEVKEISLPLINKIKNQQIEG
jgi:hypothetical protein